MGESVTLATGRFQLMEVRHFRHRQSVPRNLSLPPGH